MKEWIKKNHFLITAIIIGITMLTISVIRAVTTGITYDEAFTYLNYGKKSILYPMYTLIRTTGILANNHLLNSFLISAINTISGGQHNEFLIRLPNIIFYIIYLIYAYKLANKYKVKYLCFVILVLNYGVHEFFGLARGYGIAVALILVGIYYLKLWIEEKEKYKFLNISFITLMAAAYANSATLIVSATIVIYILVVLIKEKTLITFIKKYWYYILTLGILALLITRYHFKISGEGLPLYGGGSGFFKDVLVSMFETYGFAELSTACAIIYIIAYIVGIVYYLGNSLNIIGEIRSFGKPTYTHQKETNKQVLQFEMFYIPILCFMILAIITLITKQLWITGRSLIPFTPLIVFGFVELWETLRLNNKIVLSIASVIMVIPFIYNFNLQQTREWSDNYIIKSEVYRAYEEDDYTIIEPYLYNPAVTFYREKIQQENNE